MTPTMRSHYVVGKREKKDENITKQMYDSTACTIACCSSFLKGPARIYYFLSVQTLALYKLGSCRTEKKLRHFSRPGSTCRCQPPNTVLSGSAQPTKRERLGFPEKVRGARARRTRRLKGADCGPPPEEHPPDEPAEFRLPAP